MQRINFIGCPVDALDMQETIEKIESYIKCNGLCQHVVINAFKVVEMQTDYDLKKIIVGCQIINADSMPIVWASRLLGQPLPERVAGVDLFQALIHVCSEKSYKPFFFGARENVVKNVVKNFKKKYPNLKIAGYRNGYYSEDEEEQIALMIKNSNADMLFVGFSSPMKEKFLNKWMPMMDVPFCMGVGGSFDITAGKTKRAPVWMQNYGLEWFYRIMQEPQRMWKRYARTNPVFIGMVFTEYLKFLKRKSRK